MDNFRYADTISGGKGRLTANINGNIETVAYVKTFEATLEKQKEEGRVLGSNWVHNKANGVKGSGTLTIYRVTSLFSDLTIQYAKTGKDTYFTFISENEDPASTIGKEVNALYNVNLDSSAIGGLDIESAALEEEVPFTFEGIDRLEKFKAPTGV